MVEKLCFNSKQIRLLMLSGEEGDLPVQDVLSMCSQNELNTQYIVFVHWYIENYDHTQLCFRGAGIAELV